MEAFQEPVPVKVRYLLYCRKSSESEERQILSIESQVKEMLQIADRENLEIVEIRRESHSAKNSGQRPVFNEIVKDIRKEKYNGILTWAPDRLSRNAGDLGSLVDLIDQKLLVEIRTYGQVFTNSPSDKFLLMILCSQAKLENDNKGINVKRGQKTKCEMGLRPCLAPTGYINEKRLDRKGYVMIDPERAPIIKQMFENVVNGWSGRKVYHWLKFDINFRTRSNKHLSLSNVYSILQNTYYYGAFEYPEKSGNWYTGKHIPIITKELYEQARERLKKDYEVKSEIKEFAFTKLIKCGLCGSGISAQEKYKNLKDGSTTRYVYYGCCRGKDLNCKSGYIREEELIEQFIKIMDVIDINEMGMRTKFEEEAARMAKFQRSFLSQDNQPKIDSKDVDFRNYARYLLKEGSTIEKRELLYCVKSKFVLTAKQLTLESR